MATFTDKQQKQHRAEFIEDCRQKAWNAACNADYIAKHFDELLAEYEKLKKEDTEYEAQIRRSTALSITTSRTIARNAKRYKNAATSSRSNCNSSSKARRKRSK